MALATQADLIVLTGDYVTYSAYDVADCARELARLTAPCGVYAILGNHDHWTDAQVVQAGLEAFGLPGLFNANVRLPVGSADLWLAGVGESAISLAATPVVALSTVATTSVDEKSAMASAPPTGSMPNPT